MAENARLRLLNGGDLTAAAELSAAAGWNQTADDWRMLLELVPEGCWAMELDHGVVATTTLLGYGRKLGWIGMVLTKPEFRGRGYARRLLTHAMDRADEIGIETLKLDATDQGQPLYEKLGFRAEQGVERWTRHSGYRTAHPALPRVNDTNQAVDEDVFGADRSELLRKLTARRAPLRLGGGFLLSRPGARLSYLGPCVANDQAVARELVERCLGAWGQDGWCWDLLAANRKAIALARSLGFTPVRRLLRMARGHECRGIEERIWAIAGFELG